MTFINESMMLSHFPNKITISCLLLFLCIIPLSSTAISIDDLVYSPDSNPFGKSYSDWTIAWWNWWFSVTKGIPYDEIAASQGPCFLGRGDDVLFLIDPVVSYQEALSFDCTIPPNKAILINVISELCSYGEDIVNDAQLIDCVEQRNKFAKVFVTVDGVPIEHNTKYKESKFSLKTIFFNITFPENNVFDDPPGSNPAGTFRSLSDAMFIILKPLSIGDHIIKVKVSQIIPNRESENLNLDLTYNMHVK
jgi:hypothetical protein